VSNTNIEITFGGTSTQTSYLYSDVVARINNLILGAICSNCNYPSQQDFIRIERGRDIQSVLPGNWTNSIFHRTLEYIAPSVIMILYRDIATLTDTNTPKPDMILMHDDEYSIVDFNTLGHIAASIDSLFIANTSNLSLVDNNLYFISVPEVKQYTSIVFGNIFLHNKGYFVWNAAEYIIRIANKHYMGNYFCPIKEKIMYGNIAKYSNNVLNIIKNNHFNYPYKNIVFGPITLSSHLFSISYTNIVLRKAVRMTLRKFLLRKNGPELWSEVESELRRTLSYFESSECGPYIINVLVNDPQINNPNSNQLNVEIQYANAAGFTGFNISSGNSNNVPPLGRFINTINMYVNLV